MRIRQYRDYVIITCLAVGAFGRTLVNGFTYDDYPFLVNNPGVHALRSPVEFIANPRLHSNAEPIRTYRPLRALAFSIQYAGFGDTAFLYHGVNLLLHCSAAILLYRFLLGLVPSAGALVTTILFSVHPLQTEVVASIKAQDDLLAGLLVLWSLHLFTTAKHGSISCKSSRFWYLNALYALACFAKESAIIVPGLVIGLFLKGQRAPAGKLLQPPRQLLGVLCIIGLGYFGWRGWVMGQVESPQTSKQPPSLFASSVTYTPLYFKLFVWPAPLTVDYTRLKLINGPDFRLLISLTGQALLGFLVWRRGSAALKFGWFWFYAGLLPTLNLVPGVVILAERFMYLPIIGLSLMGYEAWRILARPDLRPRVRTASTVGFVLLVGALAIRSYVRCGDWRDNETLFKSALRVDPGSVILRNYLTHELIKKGDTQAAQDLLAETPAHLPTAMSGVEQQRATNEALLALRNRDYERAATLYEAIIASPQAKKGDRINYGTVLVNLRRYDEAQQVLSAVLAENPTEAPIMRMLGRVAYETQKYSEAQEWFDRACSIDRTNALGWYYYALTTHKQGRDADASEILLTALTAGVNLSQIFESDAGSWQDAQPILSEAINAHHKAGK